MHFYPRQFIFLRSFCQNRALALPECSNGIHVYVFVVLSGEIKGALLNSQHYNIYEQPLNVHVDILHVLSE